MTDNKLKLTTVLTVIAMLAGYCIWVDERYAQAETLKEVAKSVRENSKAVQETSAAVGRIGIAVQKMNIDNELFKLKLKEEKEGALSDLEVERYISLENQKAILESPVEIK